MTPKELRNIANQVVAEKIAACESVQMTWAVQEIINLQGSIRGEAVDFFDLCAHEHVYRVVKSVVAKYDEASTTNDALQMHLEGFEHVRCAYTISSDGEQLLIPTDLISDEELLKRAYQFMEIGKGSIAHGNELVRYVEQRTENRAAL